MENAERTLANVDAPFSYATNPMSEPSPETTVGMAVGGEAANAEAKSGYSACPFTETRYDGLSLMM